MERRLYRRVDTCIPVKYHCEYILYNGTVENISENGMFIRTTNFLPCTNEIEMIVPLNEIVTTCTAKIRRIIKTDNTTFQVGLEILNPSSAYLDFVEKLKSLCSSLKSH